MSRFPKSDSLLILTMISFISCTNIAFKQSYDGPRGIDFTKGTCIVNDVEGPIPMEDKIKLTVIITEYLHKMNSDSVILIKSLPSSYVNSLKLPNIDSTLIDSLRKDESFHFLFHVTVNVPDELGTGIMIGKTDEEQTFLDNEATVKIIVFDIRANKQIYRQEITASEMIDNSSLMNDEEESDFRFTRSSQNIIKNALIRGLKDLKRHSK